ncbi:molybdopterin-guanine dinucleotide biosynthesis protein B [Vibrio sp. PP-XX7]
MSAHHPQLPDIPVLGFAAFSGTGKTTLLEKVIPILVEHGFQVGVYKHSHHVVELDKPGKDSFRLRKAGACQTLLSTPERSILTTEVRDDKSADFYQRLTQFDTQHLDIILVEGCKEKHFPKIEIHRAEMEKPWLYRSDPAILAVASTTPIDGPIPYLDLNNTAQIVSFIETYIHQFTPSSSSQ